MRSVIIPALAVSAAVCASWFGVKWYQGTETYSQKAQYDKIYEKYRDNEHFVGVFGDEPLFDCDFTDYFRYQSRDSNGEFISDEGVLCTHGPEYTEPEIPAGKYWINGDENSGHCLEITKENGEYFLEFKNTGGTPCPDNIPIPDGRRKFIVITDHWGDRVYITTGWKVRDRSNEPEPYCDLWEGTRYYFDYSGDNICLYAEFDESGNARIGSVPFVDDLTDAYILSDRDRAEK